MFAFKHLALASVAGLAISLGAIGCQPERPDVISPGAQLTVSGNQDIRYTAPADGKVSIYDKNAQRLLWSGNVWKDQTVEVDTQRGQIMVGGNVVMNKLLAPLDEKDIYFERTITPPGSYSNTNNTNNGVLVTPNVTVQPSNGASTSGGVNVQPGVNVSPAPAQ